MLRLSYMTPTKVAGEIEFARRPMGLGYHTDIHGECWHVQGIIGDYVQAARRREMHSYYVDTSGRNFDSWSQTWLPYRIKTIEDQGNG